MTTKTVSITSNTYAVREQLKALGGKWNSAFKCWDVPESRVAEANALVQAQPVEETNVIDVPMGPARIGAKNYTASCPTCDGVGGRRSRHLSVLKSDPTVYRCWHGCTPEEIKLALGIDSHARIRFIK